MQIGGNTPRRLLHDSSPNAFLPSWTPDGRGVGFITASWRRITIPEDFDLSVQQIDSMGAAVGAMRSLVAEEGEDYGPAWSPDGRWLAFHGHLEETDDIWIRSTGDTPEGPIRLTWFGPGADTGEPDWSPDGRMLAFSSHGPPKDGIPSWAYTLAIDPETGRALGAPRRLALHGFEGSVMGARFSPDGRRIAFYGRSDDDGRVTVYTVAAGGGQPTPLVTFTNGEPYGGPEWNRDGGSLFYSRNDGFGVFQIWEVDVVSSGTRRITNASESALQPSVSPDGQWLAMTLWDNAIDVMMLPAPAPGFGGQHAR